MFFTRSRSTLILSLLERSPRLQRTPEPSVTQNPILFDPNRLSQGHSFQKRDFGYLDIFIIVTPLDFFFDENE